MTKSEKVLIDWNPNIIKGIGDFVLIEDDGEYTCVLEGAYFSRLLRSDFTWFETPEAARMAAEIHKQLPKPSPYIEALARSINQTKEKIVADILNQSFVTPYMKGK